MAVGFNIVAATATAAADVYDDVLPYNLDLLLAPPQCFRIVSLGIHSGNFESEHIILMIFSMV